MLEKFEDLKGKVLASVENKENEELVFTLVNGDIYKLYHEQDYCECVYIEDIIGNLDDLVNSSILMAEEISNANEPENAEIEYRNDSETWTFYKLATIKGYVTIRWYGSSNGYYSESVDWRKVN